MGLCFAMFVFLTFRGPLASHDSNPYPNRSRIARYNATQVPRMAGPGRFPSEFRENSEQSPSSEQVPGKFRASIPNPLFLVILCNESPWLADNRERTALGVKPTMRGTQQRCLGYG